jgi:hypothetical protein
MSAKFSLTTAQDQLYLVGLSTLRRVPFQFVPESLTESRNVDWQEVKPVQRNTPLYQYTGGSTEIQLQLSYYSTSADRRDVEETVAYLKSLTYSDGFEAPPERVQLVWGELYPRETWIVKALSVATRMPDPTQGMRPVYADVSLTLALDPDLNIRVSDVRR